MVPFPPPIQKVGFAQTVEEGGRWRKAAAGGERSHKALHSTASPRPLFAPPLPLAVQRGSGKMVKYVVIRGAERGLLSYKGRVVPASRI